MSKAAREVANNLFCPNVSVEDATAILDAALAPEREAAKRLRTWLLNMRMDPRLDANVREGILRDIAAFDATQADEKEGT